MKFLVEPLLNAPAPGWSHDLPAPKELPSLEPSPNLMPQSPLHVDDVYLELARNTVRTRGGTIWVAILLAPFMPVTVFELLQYTTVAGPADLLVILALGLAFLSVLWMVVFSWRIDTAPPRNEPIRFNRARRKVYVYRFHYAALRPFSRTAWFTRAEVYDWDDLRAEACSIYGPMGSGGLIETVSIAVVEPGTNLVIDRFQFVHGGLEGEMYWALAQLYMQQGPQALPKFERPPRDWNNEKVIFNLARRLAPKVQWPEDLDLESRTAPSETGEV